MSGELLDALCKLRPFAMASKVPLSYKGDATWLQERLSFHMPFLELGPRENPIIVVERTAIDIRDTKTLLLPRWQVRISISPHISPDFQLVDEQRLGLFVEIAKTCVLQFRSAHDATKQALAIWMALKDRPQMTTLPAEEYVCCMRHGTGETITITLKRREKV